MNQLSTSPIAAKHPQELVTHGDKRIDNYYWLRQQDNPEVIDYLKTDLGMTERSNVFSDNKDYKDINNPKNCKTKPQFSRRKEYFEILKYGYWNFPVVD